MPSTTLSGEKLLAFFWWGEVLEKGGYSVLWVYLFGCIGS